MKNCKVKSFVAYFYDENGKREEIKLSNICGSNIIKEENGMSIMCMDAQNEKIKKLKDKTLKVIIRMSDETIYILQKCNIFVWYQQNDTDFANDFKQTPYFQIINIK